MVLDHWDFLFGISTAKIKRDHFVADFYFAIATTLCNDQEKQSLFK